MNFIGIIDLFSHDTKVVIKKRGLLLKIRGLKFLVEQSGVRLLTFKRAQSRYYGLREHKVVICCFNREVALAMYRIQWW
jgi:hypothetical protein